MLKKTALVTAVSAAMVLPAQVMAQEVTFDFYGSARFQVESVSPDGADSYTGTRDAYSRIGFNAEYAPAENFAIVGQLELPLDLANRKVQDPANGQSEDVRIAMVGVTGDFGGLYYGRQWLPYYNAIAFPVDMFSSFYSGFATWASFRVDNTLSYYSPSFNGFSFAGSWSENGGPGNDDQITLTASYSFNDTTLSLGAAENGFSTKGRDYGVSVMHSIGDWYIGAKYEMRDNNDASDGDKAANLFVSYNLGQHTFKGMIAKVDNYGGDIYHLGYDFQVRSDLTLFVDYYSEDEGAAIAKEARLEPFADFTNNVAGGSAFAVGARFDF
ncbi:Outer membrane protein (porin) [Ectothiorhodosinus mongolicus]|uniref:Outer membrane protein (Porin) n=1 Tax=Ectothiorhodosinus mongolicus TaxID=233100 RepID=A0A1R3VVT3_9GAMM|nr:porin [Ectothiorhodosinus mongolicus]ULX56942.1 porin [Ectothiorhodosinus mongolicus]SIT69102.1 Outer membrane protein (porin) [Ectothiorhodosinus mongolicus]